MGTPTPLPLSPYPDKHPAEGRIIVTEVDTREPDTPRRIQRQRTKGWRMPDGAVYVGRPTRWGNPYRIGEWVTLHADETEAGMTCDLDGRAGITAVQAVEGYRDLMQGRMAMLGEPPYDPADQAYVEEWRRAVEQLRGHDLVCWCPLDQPCHADVLLELANRSQS